MLNFTSINFYIIKIQLNNETRFNTIYPDSFKEWTNLIQFVKAPFMLILQFRKRHLVCTMYVTLLFCKRHLVCTLHTNINNKKNSVKGTLYAQCMLLRCSVKGTLYAHYTLI